MTWSARITDRDGNPSAGSICGGCKHAQACNVKKYAHTVGYNLTSIDGCCDGHMASGNAELRCSGYEANTEAEKAEEAA